MRREDIRRTGGVRQLTNDINVLFAPYFQPKAIYFTEGTSFVYLDQMKFDTGYPFFEEGKTMMAAVDALRLIYGPEMTVTQIGVETEISYRGKTVRLREGEQELWTERGAVSMELPARIIDGVLYAAVESLMKDGFGKAARWEGTYLAPKVFLGIGERDEDLFGDMNVVKDMTIHLNKKVGVLKRAYFYEKAGKVCPYAMYVPMNCNPKKPNKLAMILHGAMQGASDLKWIASGHGEFERLAEQYQTILLFVDGYAEGFYGGGTKPTLNRRECGEEIQYYLDLCEGEPFAALEEVKKEFCIDEENIVLFGNSMGGGGTFYLGNAYPQVFRAMAPCGALLSEDLTKIDMDGIKGKPILLVAGTENIDFDNLPKTAEYMGKRGARVEYLGVGGGIHADAWIKALPDIFAFFERV